MGIFGWVKHAAETVGHGVTEAANTTAKGVVTAANATAKGVVIGGKATGQGLETAGKTVGKGMATAQNGLTNLMYPDLEKKQREVKSLENRYNNQRQSLTTQTHLFDQRLKTYQEMVAYNAALLISLSVLRMSDERFAKYVEQVENNTPIISLDSLPAQLSDSGKSIAFLAGGVLTLRAVRNIGTLAKSNLFSSSIGEGSSQVAEDIDAVASSAADAGVTEGVAEGGEAAGEAIAEASAEGAAEAGLAETGVGIIAAAGIFALFSAIQGAQEEKKLNEAIDKLHSALNQVDGFLSQLEVALSQTNHGILSEESRFLQIMSDLNSIQPAGFNYKYPASLASGASYASAMLHAVGQYGFVNKARVFWHRMQARGISWDEFVSLMVTQRDSTYITENEAKAFLNLLRKYSASMQKA